MKKWNAPEIAEVKISETACFDWFDKWWEPTPPANPTPNPAPNPGPNPAPGVDEEDFLS